MLSSLVANELAISGPVRLLQTLTRESFVLVARDNFNAGKRQSLCWRGSRHVLRSINDLVYLAENLKNAQIDDTDSTGLKFYRDPLLKITAIM